MPAVESKPTPVPITAPEPDDLPPKTPYSIERVKDEAERKALETERDYDLSPVIATQLLSQGRVAPEIKIRRDTIQARLAEIAEREIALEPFVRSEERKVLIYNQKVGFKQRQANQAEAAKVQAHLDDLNAQVKKAEDDLHFWKVKAPDGLFNASTQLGKHRIKFPDVIEEEA